MTSDSATAPSAVPKGFRLARLHAPTEAPLALCVLVRVKEDPTQGSFVRLREVPGARVYLGAVADAQGRIQDWLEVWVHTLDLSDPGIAGAKDRLTNDALDKRWHRDLDRALAAFPETVILTGMETLNPSPIALQFSKEQTGPFVESTPLSWRLCRDDALLQSLGLPAYATSSFRYLHDPAQGDGKKMIATHSLAPTNPNVQGLEAMLAGSKGVTVFNAHAGLVRVQRLTPLTLEDCLAVLEGNAWEPDSAASPMHRGSVYAGLQEWSKTPKGLPFLLHGKANAAERLNEVLFLKLSLLRGLFLEVRAQVKAQQLPLLNLTPASFAVGLQPVGEAFPTLWTARAQLVKPGQALPLDLKGTDQRYFIRLGTIPPSPFLSEEQGAHSAGVGQVYLRAVQSEGGGTVIDGKLVAQDYLSVQADDLLWLRFPLKDQPLELHGRIERDQGAGPKELRFRTIPAQLSPPALSALKSAEGTEVRCPYEIWPMLSSPGDLYSLGVIAVRLLFANADTSLPLVKDDVLSLSRRLGQEDVQEPDLAARLLELLEGESRLKDCVSPQALAGLDVEPEQARAMVASDVWWRIVCLVLRLFPGLGNHSFSRGFGDVSPVALETTFDRPLQELEELVLRQRSVVLPGQAANAEIAAVLAESLESA